MRKYIKLAAGILFTASAACADTWSFESLVFPGSSTTVGQGTNIEDWTVTGNCGGNCVLVLRNNYTETYGQTLNFLAQDGDIALDITGAGNTGVNGISRTFNLIAGRSYNLSFWIGDINGGTPNFYAQPATLGLSITGFAPFVFVNPNGGLNATWEQHGVTFTASASTTIAFTNLTLPSDSYLGLDNVSLTLVPEPTGPAALSAGAIGLLLAARVYRRWRVN